MTQTNDPPTVLDIGLIPNSNEKADLDAPSGTGGKLVIGQAPNITITETNVVADAAERLALDVQEGDIAIQTNVSSSFIFTGGDNIANNWETLDFDAVGAISGETISPANIDVSGSINGADTSAAGAGEALTSDGTGSFAFTSVGGIEEVATFSNLPAIDPPQLAYVTGTGEYYQSSPQTGTPFDITSASFSTSIPSQDLGPRGIAWNDDGSRLYEVGRSNGGDIYQFTVPDPFDISSASFETSIATRDKFPQGIAWNNDGSRMYIAENELNDINQYTVSTPFDISSASFSTSINSADGFPTDLAWNDDGSQFYELGGFGTLYQYSVSTPFDITTASVSTTFATQDSLSRGIAWNDDGSRLYEVGDGSGGDIYQFTVSTPFDITTASFSTQIASQDSSPTGIQWNTDGSRLYEVGKGNSGDIYQYTVSTGGWQEF